MKDDEPRAQAHDLNNETLSAKRIPICKNVDNHDLLPCDEIPTLTFGNVPEVNGLGAEEVRHFIPTHHELLVLARHWADVAIWRNFHGWANETASSSDYRRIFFAWRRVDRIRNLLGEDAVDQVISEEVNDLYEQYAKGCSPEDWEKFLHFVDRDAQKECLPPVKHIFQPPGR